MSRKLARSFVRCMAAIPLYMMGLLPAPATEPTSTGLADGCEQLRERSRPVCLARVRCPVVAGVDGGDAAETQAEFSGMIEKTFRQCARGEPVSVDRVENILLGFPSELVFRCCVGNAFFSRFPWGDTDPG